MNLVFCGAFVFVLLMLSRIGFAQENNNSDWRDISEGHLIPTPGMKYVDQPYVVHTDDGSWLCILTVGTLGETIGGSVNFSAATTSEDKGKTWSPFIKCNITYAVPLRVPSGRVYTLRPPMSFTYSDDNAETWSKGYPFPDSVAIVDGIKSGWAVSMPVIVDNAMYLAWAKIGLNSPPRKTEVFLYKSDNILTEKDPNKIQWQRMPDGDVGLRAPDWDKPKNRSEEPHLVSLSDGTLYTVWRTDQGYIGESASKDNGATWSNPVYVTYANSSRRIKNPLACPSMWKCANGKYLLWIHNHSGKTYSDRNPAWICGGVEGDGQIEWSQPEVLLYSDDLTSHSGRLSYPGFLDEDGSYWVFETQKTIARVHEIDPTLFEAAWNQSTNKAVAGEGLILSLNGAELKAAEMGMPQLPDLAVGGGFSIGLWLQLSDLSPGQIVLDCRDSEGRGIAVTTAENGSLRLDMSDGKLNIGWDSDPGLLEANTLHHVVFIVDAGPRIITVVVDGQLCDGGQNRQFGWGRFGEYDAKTGNCIRMLGDVNGKAKLKIAPSMKGELKSLRIYDRHLLTSEAVGNYNAGPPK